MTREDTISRQAVIEQTYNWSKDEFLRVTNPFDYLRKRINSLPSVTSQSKIGYWIEGQTNNPKIHNILCSNCSEGYQSKGHANSQYTRERFKFCPNCGARMKGE